MLTLLTILNGSTCSDFKSFGGGKKTTILQHLLICAVNRTWSLARSKALESLELPKEYWRTCPSGLGTTQQPGLSQQNSKIVIYTSEYRELCLYQVVQVWCLSLWRTPPPHRGIASPIMKYRSNCSTSWRPTKCS